MTGSNRSFAGSRWVSLTVFLLFSSPAFSQDVIGLNEALRLSLENHEAVGIASEVLAQTKEDIGRAYSRVLPSITLESSYTRYTEKQGKGSLILQPGDSSRFEATLHQPIYGGGREWSLLRQAKKTRESTEVSLEETREVVALEALRAYYGVMMAKKEAGIQGETLKRAQEQLRVANARYKAGDATKAHVLRAEAEAAEKEASLIKAKGGLSDSLEGLKRITGIDTVSDVLEEETGLTKDTGVETDELIKAAFEKRKDYRRKIIAEEISREGITYAKGNFMPSLSLEGVYTFRDQNPKTSFLLEDSAYAVLTFSFPVFEGGLRTAELNQARSRLKTSELERLGLKREIEKEIRRAATSVITARAIIDAYRKEAAFAEENYSMVFKQYQYGLASSTDIVEANSALSTAQLSLSSGQYDYAISVIELKKSAGLLLEEVEKELDFVPPASAVEKELSPR